MSTSSKPQLTAEEIQKTRKRFQHFRILVIGRANAGKTTMLRSVCNTTDEPIILDPNGSEIKLSTLNPSLKRGEHDIENQMIFKSNPGFIFHDSRGFEAGGDRELKLVQQFIEKRSKAKNVNEQLHTIWYCIPTTDDRPITFAEKKFFNECGTGLVPVIVLWTKTDFLDVAKWKQLKREGNSDADARQQAPEKAWADFESRIIPCFAEFKYPPSGYVAFRKMHEPGGNCNELIAKTTDALSSEDLQQLLLSTQQNNIELCMEYGIKGMMKKVETRGLKDFKGSKGNWAYFVMIILWYFPHYYISSESSELERSLSWSLWSSMLSWRSLSSLWSLEWELELERSKESSLDITSISHAMSYPLSGLSTHFNYKEATYCAIVAAIVGHLSFFLFKESPGRKDSLERAAQIYQQSSHDSFVKQAVDNLFEGYHEQDNRGIPNISQSFRFDDKMVKGAIQIALNNRLPLNQFSTPL